jgi:sarcosine oxidase
MAGLMDIVVVGAGVFGAWCAHHLVAAGDRVTLVDAYGPANSKASSGDESRIVRCGYGTDEIYSQWARASLVQWRAAIDHLVPRDAPLFHQCGVLWLAGDDAYTAATFETLRQGGYPVERLGPTELHVRFPQIRADDVGLALFEPDCGVVMARRTVQALVASLAMAGLRLLRGQVAAPEGGGRIDSVRMTSGEAIPADAFVFACGPWLPTVFPNLLGGRIRPTRQVVMYFGTPPGDARFGPERTPAWIDFAAGIYGIPDLEHRGVKVGIDRHGPPFDPDRGDRVADAASIDMARTWLARRMPALAAAPVIESRVCQYENTDTGDFLIDRHPDFDNVWIAGGGSGHGFKHGPRVGEYVAGLVHGSGSREPRFALDARGTMPQRSVY